MDDDGDGKLRLRAWYRMLLATRTMSSAIRERLRVQFDVTLPRFDVMAALYRSNDAITMSELSRYLMVSNGNITGIIDRLVADRLVERQADKKDRRTVRVRLSRKGRDNFGKMAAAHESWVRELLGTLDDQEVGDLLRIVERID